MCIEENIRVCSSNWHFLTPYMAKIEKKHLFDWIFGETWQFLINIFMGFSPFLIGLENRHLKFKSMNDETYTKKACFNPTISAMFSLCVFSPFIWTKNILMYTNLNSKKKDLKINLSQCVIVVLFDNTFLTLIECVDSLISPQRNFVHVHINISTLIIKAMCNLMSHNKASG